MKKDATAPSRLGELVRTELTGDVSTDEHARGRERLLLAALHERALPKRRRSRPALLLMAAALGAIGLWMALPLLVGLSGALHPRTSVVALAPSASPDAIRFDVATNAEAERGEGFIDATSGQALLSFSDGSRVTFAKGARGRVADRAANGARIVLSSGVVDLDIVHRDATSWIVEAGPHVVRVTGTSFRVRFDSDTGRFEVRMREGRVIVAGPGAPDGIPAVRGQVVVAEKAGGYRIGDAAALPEQDAVEASTAPGEPKAAPVAAPSAAPSETASVDWTSKVSRGEYQAVVDEAKARGLDSVADAAPLADLVALADAARYTKAPAVARHTLEAQRKRFADTTAGRTATFLLGRIAEDSDGNAARALELYDAYLSSGGSFSAEALGRKMMIVERTKGRAVAQPIARAYLEAYPKGAYAAVARTILSNE